ncbi:MAG: hypothetical protein AUF76_10105 [Acidobacteria bacterium 13_1_20CM_2_65_9]|nr:MAG: hypothetical protein AUF76_10105 [Acidobacteria bacterium 13_1_20CM_2_65_9]
MLLWAAAGALASVTAGLDADQRASKRDAELLRQKVATISAHGERPSKQGRRTTVTEGEVNSYLVYDAKPQLPAGVIEPAVTILGTGRLSGRAVVDLDAVRHARASQSWFDPTNYLTGRLPVSATGRLKTSNGVGHFELESASVGGVPVPKMLLQEIVSYYTRTPEKPSGIGLDDPFALPARIREIQVERGQAIIVQ